MGLSKFTSDEQEEIDKWLMTCRQNWPGSKQKTRD